MLWFLDDKEYGNLCKGSIRILDGRRLSEIWYNDLFRDTSYIRCVGVIKRIAGFKLKQMMQPPINFNVLYELQPNQKYKVIKSEFKTSLGIVVMKVLDK
jgi:hypothetical protein